VRRGQWAYRTVIGAARGVFRALDLRIDVEGDEHVPRTGPVVVASNHVSFLDFMLVGLAARGSRRDVRFLARHELFAHPVAGPFLRSMRHVPVDRAAPAAAYLRSRTLLRRGEAVGIFPEAGVSTSFTVRSLMPGPVALARELGVPIVPMAIWGPQRILTAHRPVDLHRGRPVSLLVGPPLYVDPSTDLRRGTELLGRTVQALLDDLQARPVHQPRPGEPAPWHPAHLGGGAPSVDEARAEESVPRSAVPPSWRPLDLPRAG
jgi:1-acyl-sn-glycerol-3-phosphate acyltransferase